MGYTGKFWVASPPDEVIFVQIAGKEYVEGYLTAVSVPTEGPSAPAAAKELKQAYIDKYGEWTSMAIAGSYVYALPIFKAAIESVGSLDTDKVRAVLDSGKIFDTMFGPVTFWGKELYGIGHQVLKTVFITEIRDGKLTIIDEVKPQDIYNYLSLPKR